MLSYDYFMIILDRYYGSCKTFYDSSGRICVPNKAKDVNLNVFNMITRIYKLKTSRKHISCGYECKFDGRKYNSKQKWNNNT